MCDDNTPLQGTPTNARYYSQLMAQADRLGVEETIAEDEFTSPDSECPARYVPCDADAWNYEEAITPENCERFFVSLSTGSDCKRSTYATIDEVRDALIEAYVDEYYSPQDVYDLALNRPVWFVVDVRFPEYAHE